MNIVTFNLRCDCGVDKHNNFSYRKPFIVEKIEVESPDIICFQEVMDHMAQWLNESLPAYTIVGCGRNELLDGEQMSIAIKKEGFQIIALDHFWLSDTPTIPGSQFAQQSGIPRMCTQCFVREYKTKKILRVVNTHLDHVNATVRAQAITQIMQTLSVPSIYKEHAIILAGDFNATPDSPEMAIVNEYPTFKCLTPNIGCTFHGYFYDYPVSNVEYLPQIDYIFLQGNARVMEVTKWMDVHNGVYLSDHYPVAVVLECV